MGKKSILLQASLMLIIVMASSVQTIGKTKERPQWTEEQAWEWEKRVGVIKGFNYQVNKKEAESVLDCAAGRVRGFQYEPSYPCKDMEETFKRMSELGFNSTRVWVGGLTAEEQVERLKYVADVASKYGLTISPSLYIHKQYFDMKGLSEEERLAAAEKCVKTIIAPFKDDDRIVFWDIWNEPTLGRDSAKVNRTMDWLEKEVHWCREEHLSQPITASIFWDAEYNADTTSVQFQRRMEIEKMMDVHNFHDYLCSEHFGKDARAMIRRLKKMGNRPLICTECLTRVNGSGLTRSLAEFSKEHVHFYIWGSFANNANWEVSWGRSTFDPYEPYFHNVMYSDGDLIDYREIEAVRNFKFTNDPDEADPGLEYTERWPHERAWKWVSSGPIKGLCNATSPSEGYNSIRMELEYSKYKDDKDAFFNDLDQKVNAAMQNGYTIMPVLLTDKDANASNEELGKYVADVVQRYYSSPAVEAWDLYYHPGEEIKDSAKVSGLVTTVFRYARNEYPTQPLTMTPYVWVKKFDPDFDYRRALEHGTRGGWDQFEYEGGSTPGIVYKIWSLSDVLSFSTDQSLGEGGWIASVCYKFGRPVFCTNLSTADSGEVAKLLDQFAKSHVFWYSSSNIPEDILKSFRFIPIITKHR